MSHSSSTLQTVLSNLLIDCRIAVEWFSNNGMKANPNKFQLMISSPNSADNIQLKWDENTTLRSEKSVKALGVIIENRLTVSDHISACRLKAARQLNALARISKYLDPKSKSNIYNSFIRSNFEYCPLVWQFCGKTNNNKLEKTQERSLRILQDTYELSYEELLNRNGSSYFSTEQSYSFWRHTNLFMVWMLAANSIIRLTNDDQWNLSNQTDGPLPMGCNRSYIHYLGSKLHNDIVNSDPGIANCDFNDLVDFLKHWEGPSVNEGFPYVWMTFYYFECTICFITYLPLSCYELFLRSSITLCVFHLCTVYIMHPVVY